MFNFQKLLIFAVLVIVVLLGLTSWQIRKNIIARHLSDVEQSLQAVLKTTQQGIRTWLEEHKAIAKYWANTPQVKKATMELLAIPHYRDSLLTNVTQSRLRQELKPLSVEKSYQGYFIIGPDFTNLASRRDVNIGKRSILIHQRKFLESVLSGEIVISLPYKSDVLLPDKHGILRVGLPTMFVGAPIKNDSSEVIAILTLRIDPAKSFINILQQARIGISGETYAFDATGRLISESRFDQQLITAGILDPHEKSILNLFIRDPGVNLIKGEHSSIPVEKQPLTKMATSAIAGNMASDLQGYRDYRGVMVVGAWVWDDELGFGIATEINKTIAYSTLQVVNYVILSLTLLTIGLIIGMAMFVMVNRDRRRALKALSYSEERLKAQYKGSPVPTYTWQRQARGFVLIDYNDAAVDITKGGVEHYQGVVAEVFFADRPDILAQIEQCYTEKNMIKKEFWYQFENSGDNRCLDVTYTFVPSDLILVHVKDITKHRLAEDVLRKAQFGLELRVRERTQELDDTSKELIKEMSERQQAQEALKESEQKFRAIFEQAAVGVALIETHSGRFLKINRKYCEILGYSEEEMYQKDFQTITHAEDLQEDLDNMDKLMNGDISEFSMEKRYLCKDGSIVWVNLAVSPMWNIGELPDYHIAIVENITQRKYAEKLLRQERDNAQRYLDTVEAMIIGLDKNGNITLVNRKGCELLGYSEEELLGKNWFTTCLPAPMGEKVVLEVFKSIMSGELAQFEYFENPILTRSGEQRLIAWHNNLFRDNSGNIIGTLGAGEDITQRKKAEEQARQHQAELAHMARLNTMGEMATGIAHELNQPLTAVTNYANVCQQLLRKENIQVQSLMEALNGISTQSMRAAQIIQRLREFVRKQGPQLRNVQLNELVSDVINFIAAEADKNTILIRLRLDEHLPLVNADAIQIEQVLLNLVRNGMEAMVIGNCEIRELTITTLKNRAGEVAARVADSGPGMEENVLAHIFEPFFGTKDGTGMGMGLSICRSIIQAHHGKLTAKSEPGAGSIFFFTLPTL